MTLPKRFTDAAYEYLNKSSHMKYDTPLSSATLHDSILQMGIEIDEKSIKRVIEQRNAIHLSKNLTTDELGALLLYLGSIDHNNGEIYSIVNNELRGTLTYQISKCLPYIQLLIAALKKLPSKKGSIWRFTKGNLSHRYPQGKKFVWSGFSSCVLSKTSVESALDKDSEYTIFKIEGINGKSVKDFSDLSNVDEILLMPNTYLEVIKFEAFPNKLYIIDLREIEEVHGKESIVTTHQPYIDMQSSSTSTQTGLNNEKRRHPACQYKSDNSWLDCTFREASHNSIMTPEDLSLKLIDPVICIEPSILDRVRGSMFGMAVGDAVGAHVEFRPHEYLVQYPVTDMVGGGTWGLDKGKFTDDTSMGLCLASSLIARKDFVPYDQLVRYKWWHKHGYMSSTGVCFDIGSATKKALETFERRQIHFSNEQNIPIEDLDFLSDSTLLSKFDVKCSDEDAAGNGALMRLAPVPLFFYRKPADAVKFSGESSAVTHGDRKSVDACRYFGALIVAALHGVSKRELLAEDFYEKHSEWFNNQPLCSEIISIAHGSFKEPMGYAGGIRGSGYVVNALRAALWAFNYDEDSFKVGCLKAVNLGDDTDTTAAIYGQLAGAFYGYSKLPEEWTKLIYAAQFITSISQWIIYEGYKGNDSTARRYANSIRALIPNSSRSNAEVMTQRELRLVQNDKNTQGRESDPGNSKTIKNTGMRRSSIRTCDVSNNPYSIHAHSSTTKSRLANHGPSSLSTLSLPLLYSQPRSQTTGGTSNMDDRSRKLPNINISSKSVMATHNATINIPKKSTSLHKSTSSRSHVGAQRSKSSMRHFPSSNLPTTAHTTSEVAPIKKTLTVDIVDIKPYTSHNHSFSRPFP